MVNVKPGDIVRIVDPMKNRVVNTGYVNLHVPDLLYSKIPKGVPQRDLKVIDNLIEWGILAIEEDIEESTSIDTE